MATTLKIEIKEDRGNFVEKVGEFRGSPELCADHILTKYGNGVHSLLQLPASDLRKEIKELMRSERQQQQR